MISFSSMCRFVFLLLFGCCSILHGQNLVPNYSFENITDCPNPGGGGGPNVTPPWVAPTAGTSDIFNTCYNLGFAGVPSNFFGYQEPFFGEGYSGFYTKVNISLPYREYIQTELTQPLVANTWYTVGFYVSLADNNCGIEHIGAYLSPIPISSGGSGPLLVTPQIVSSGGFLDDTVNWTLISGCFLAQGGEAFITIGNFETNQDNPIDPDCNLVTSYYYCDDVFVVEGMPPEPIDFDLGGPVEACFEYEIDPGLTGYTFTWEDGSHGPTLTVTESGIYGLTVTDGCSFGTGSIEVTILGDQPPVEIGTDQVTICNGEVYNISLDPDQSTYTWQDGSNNPFYQITTAGTYAVTLDNGCVSSTDEITVDVLDPPADFSLGQDTVLCFDTELFYSFDPSLGDFLWQDGNTTSTYLITTGGVYSLIISNMCGEVMDEIEVIEEEMPEVELGPQQQALCVGESIVFNLDPDAGDILWQDGSTDASYTISTSGLYSVIVTNTCGSASDEVEVTATDLPLVSLGEDTVLCTGATFTLTTDPVEGTYLWQDNSSADTFLVTSAGWYHLTIDNACGDATDSVYVDYHPVLTDPAFGSDLTLCPGEELILYAGNPGAEYLWQDNSTADSLLVTTSGIYFVEVFNECDLVTDTIVVTVNNNPPQLDLVDELLLCQGDAILLEAPVSGVTYLWNDGTTLSTILVTQPGTYSLTISNACGSDQDTVIVMDGGPAPFVELGSDTSFCAGEIITLSPDNANIDSWLWGDGSTLSNFSISSPGQITVQVSNTCGIAFDTINATLLPAVPELDLGADTAVCPGENVVLNISIPDVDILWSDGSTGSTLSTTDEGIYFASITNACGVSYDTTEVTFLPDIPPLNLGPDQSLCPGETVTIDPGINDVEYLWHDGSTLATYSTTQGETIILTITNACGTISDTLEVVENNQGPIVDLGPDILACEGEIITIPSGISGVDYLWQDGSTNSSFTTSISGEFILQVSNACGTDTDTILVDIHGTSPIVDLGSDTTLCEGEILVLTSSAVSENTILWQDGSAGNTYTVSTAGTYSLFESNHCGEDTDTITVTYTEAPEPFDLGADTSLCPGESITLSAPNTSDDILWQDGSEQVTMIADQPQTYWLQISNNCGMTSDSMIISFDHNTPVLSLATSISWCEGDIITLDATQPFTASYQWSNGAITSSINVAEPDLYEVIVSTDCQMTSTEVDVYPGDDCIVEEVNADIFIPNVFSPNRDGVNDAFVVFFRPDLNVVSMQGNIYDRWGNLVFSSEENPFTWDGEYAAKAAQSGVYVYLIRLVTLTADGEKEVVYSGDITLLR